MYVYMYVFILSLFFVSIFLRNSTKISKISRVYCFFFLIPKFIQFLCRKMAKFGQEKEKEKSSDITKM
jgi:hypothetical protein